MKFLKKMIITFTILIAAIAIGTYLFMQGKQFGELPSGKRLERILKSVKTIFLSNNRSFPTSWKPLYEIDDRPSACIPPRNEV
jgi:hypothetical protein